MEVLKLNIAGYRSIREIRHLEFDRLNLIVGANGSGKTNLYRSMELLQAAAQGTLARSLLGEGGMPAALWRGARRKGPMRVVIGISFAEMDYEIQLGLPVLGQTAFGFDPLVKEETIHVTTAGRRICMLDRKNTTAWVRDEQGRKVEFAHALSEYESILSELRQPASFPLLAMLRAELLGWRFYHRFRTDDASPLRQPQAAVRTPVLGRDGGDLAAALQTIKEIGIPGELSGAVNAAFPGSALEVLIHGSMFSFGLRMPEFAEPLMQQELSDGTLQYLCLLAALLSPRPSTFLVLNEPETSLHGDMLPALARLVSHAAKSSQMLVTTHSSRLCELINEHRRANTLSLEKVNGETRIKGYTSIGARDE
jgi:predicted ATPase